MLEAYFCLRRPPLLPFKGPFKGPYAHIKVLVTFLLVNFLGFWVIARNPSERF